ncbi:hypothetical protein FH972_021185 [Carpinus fangiana]|uniref:protein-synthesizing GTPase n=1 Tax=Carpinus fangiana TaxID=176857 RepID=A0A5N6KQS3_9ROSI|nr:hypothetical protein FH972_021185 [Carpinus fangiana]
MATPQPSSSTSRRPSSNGEVYVGQYKRLEAIGKGSFAIVYKAVHPSDKSLLAIKTVQHSQLKGKLKANLFSEIDILKSIKHPHIVALLNILESANHIHLVMEFCQLGDLATFVKKRDKLAMHPVTADMVRHYPNPPGAGFNEVIVRHFAKQLASALEFLRSKNLVHRDLKPQNLLLNPPPSWIATERPENRPFEVAKNSLIPATGVESLPVLKIADFGFARQLENKGMAETLCGSPLYMAPEILRYEKYDAKADLWSVGTVLYELMTGKPPFRAANHVDLLRKIERAMDRIRFPDECIISEDMQKVIRALLKKMPTERLSWEGFFQSAIITDPIPGLIDSDKPARNPSNASQDAESAPLLQDAKRRISTDGHGDSAQQQERQTVQRRFSSARTGGNGTPPGPSPLSHRQDAEGPSVRPPLASHATAPANPVRNDRIGQVTSTERRKSQQSPSPGTSVPKSPSEKERIAQRNQDRAVREAREKAALDVAFERDYVMVEKRQVQVNAFADELAASPQIQGGQLPAQAVPMVRRATTQGLQTAGAQTAPSRNMQIATRPEAHHERANSYERRYGPAKASATSALAAALNMVQFRLYGGSLPFGKNPSPPQGYGAFPTFPSQPSGPLLIGDASNKTGPVDEDQKVLNTVEECATRSDVVYGFAEVKYKQLAPAAPSNDNPLGIHRPGLTAIDGGSDEDDLTADAIVSIAEEALVLYVKTLAILTNTITLAGSWWSDKNRNEAQSEVAASPRQVGGGRQAFAAVGVRVNHVVQWARNRFNECLEKSEYVSRRLVAAQKKLPHNHPGHPNNHPTEQAPRHKDLATSDIYLSSGVTAEKLMYDRAIEMSRTAAVNELVGEDLAGCEVAFLTAKRLLEAVLENDDDQPVKKGGNAKKTSGVAVEDANDCINGIEEGDRKKVIKLIEGMSGRLATVRRKVALHQAARRASLAKAPGATSPTISSAPQSAPTPRVLAAGPAGRLPTPPSGRRQRFSSLERGAMAYEETRNTLDASRLQGPETNNLHMGPNSYLLKGVTGEGHLSPPGMDMITLSAIHLDLTMPMPTLCVLVKNGSGKGGRPSQPPWQPERNSKGQPPSATMSDTEDIQPFETNGAPVDKFGNTADGDDSASGDEGSDIDAPENVSLDRPAAKSALKKGSQLVAEPSAPRPVLPEQPEPSTIDYSTLTPLSPEIISRQATINIGTIGHVAHGKSTVVKAISGVQTVRFKNELERNITIKLGYANAKVYKCDNEACPRPTCYRSYKSEKEVDPPCERDGCGGKYRLLRHVSFVDCPGHDILMSTMLSGAAVMDAALLLIAGNETCPQPQTSEHLAAIEIMKLNHIIILQNKVDLMREEGADQHYQSIMKFVRGTVADGSPIVPISAQLKFNIDAVCEYLCTKIPVPPRDFTAAPRMIVIRSFDVNKPGAEIDELKGGVAGGSITTGVLKLGDEIEIRPGIVSKDENGKIQCRPIYSRVETLFAEHNTLKFAVPGGLIGVGTRVDPTLCRADRLVGFVLGLKGQLPQIYSDVEINYFLLRRLLGVKTADGKQAKVAKLTKNEILMVNIGSTATGAKVVAVKGDAARLTLTSPACTEVGEKVALSRRIEKHWRLIGWATILAGNTIEPIEP